MSDSIQTVTVGIIAYNEQRYLQYFLHGWHPR